MTAIRRLGAGDVAALRALMTLFAEVFEEPETYAAAPPSDAYCADLLAQDAFIAVVATEDDAVIAGLTAYKLFKPEQARPDFYICDLAVGEAHRRRGVATALIGVVRTIAAGSGAQVVYIQAELEDTAPNALYEKLGDGQTIRHYVLSPTPSGG